MKPYARMVRTVVVAALAVAVLTAPAHARPRRRQHGLPPSADTVRTAMPADTAALPSALPAQEPIAVVLTFLDSANVGREARLSEADLASPQPGLRERTTPDSAVAGALLPAASRPAPSSREVYRIQCMAATQSDGLEAAGSAIRTKVPYPVHVMHSPPYYKLLVGEFAARADAERALFDVRGCGYPDAWIVRGIAGEGAALGGPR